MVITLDLTERETGYLTAAVVDFYHKMRAASENEFNVTPQFDERLLASLSLWGKVEEQTGVGRW